MKNSNVNTNGEKLKIIKRKSNHFVSELMRDIEDLTNNLEYQDGSRFSYMKDRLKLFIDELNSFEILGK